MKLKFILLLVIIFGVKSFGQINQVENLTWSHWYDYPNNFFELQWEAPTQPHDELVGYNIYRNNEWFRFQTETSLYNLYSDVHGFISNCDIDFLTVDNQNQPYESAISVHVTAVYNPNHIESDYSQTVFVEGFMLSINDHTKSKTTVFPNPTNGILNIEHPDLEKIDVYDVSGKLLKRFKPNSQIDLSEIPAGLYIIKLHTEKGILNEKIVKVTQ